MYTYTKKYCFVYIFCTFCPFFKHNQRYILKVTKIMKKIFYCCLLIDCRCKFRYKINEKM